MRAITRVLIGLTTAAGSILAQNAPIVVPAATATGIGLASAANYQVAHDAKWQDYEDVVILAALNGVAKASANTGQTMTAAGYSNTASQLRAALDSNIPQNPVFVDEASCLRHAIDGLMPVVNSATDSALKTGLAGLQNLKLTRLGDPVNTSLNYPASMGTSSLSVNAYQLIGDIVQEASDLAQNDTGYAAAVGPILVDLVGFDQTAAYTQIQGAYSNAVPTLPSANSDGSFTLFQQDLVNQSQAVIANVQTNIDFALNKIEAANAQPGSFAPEACTFGQIVIDSDLCDPAGDLANSAQGAITGLSKLIGLSDSSLGNQISTVGGDIIQVGKAIGQLGTISVDAGGLLGSIGSVLGVLNPVGALAGAAVSIFSSLFGGGQNANAQMLQQIQQLSQQVQRLQTDMDQQFNQVNGKLNTILATLNTNFGYIDYKLGVLNTELNNVENGLQDIQNQLNQLALNMQLFAQAQEYDTLGLYFNECLNYAANNNGLDIGQAQYGNCESQLYSYAIFNSTDVIWAGDHTQYDDGSIYTTFLDSVITGVCKDGCATPFSTDINYLAQFPAQNPGLNLLPLSNPNATLPNPDVWTLVARAFLQLAREWPQYTSNNTATRAGDIIQLGTSVQQAAHQANSTAANAGIAANHPLFNGILTKYGTAAGNLAGALQTAVNQAVAGQFQGNPSYGFDPFGGPNQATSYVPSALSVNIPNSSFTPAGPLYPPIPVPQALVDVIPDWVKLADEFNVATLKLTYAVGSPAGMTFNGIPGPINCSHGVPQYIEITGALVQGVITEVVRAATAFPQNPVFDRVAFYCVANGSTNQFVQDWLQNVNNIQSGFVPNSVDTTFDIAEPHWDPIITSSVLMPRQKQVYAEVAGQFGQDGSAVQEAGHALSGVQSLIEAYVSFGLSQSLQTNDALQAALYGTAGLKGAAAVQADLTAFANTPPGAADNGINDESNAITSAAANLQNVLTTVLNQIQQSGTPDSLSEIDSTLQDLRSFVTLKNASALSACAWQLSSGSSNLGSAGGHVMFTVSTTAGCPVTASSGSPWLKVSTTQVSPAMSQISIQVEPASGGSRSGIVLVGDHAYRVSQYPQSDGCRYSLTAQAATYGPGAANGTVNVVAGPGCPWSVTTAVPAWVSIKSGSSGTGNGTVQLSISANSGLPPRSAELTIAEMPFAVTQLGNLVGGQIVSPVPGSTISGPVTFTWIAGTGTSGSYQLTIGTTGPGSSDVLSTNVSGTSVAVTVPTNGITLYVRLYSQEVSSGAWVFNDYTYTGQGPFRSGPILASVAPPHATGWQFDSMRIGSDQIGSAAVRIQETEHSALLRWV